MILEDKMAAPILWITGLAGSGKSTLAHAVVQALQQRGLRPLLLDGDALRDALETQTADHSPNHSREMRLARAWRMAKLARYAAVQGVPVVVATMALFHEVQAWSRSGPVPYGEVWLDANLNQLRQHRPHLYDGHAEHIVGVDIEPEYPLQAEVHIRQRFVQADMAQHLVASLGLWGRL